LSEALQAKDHYKRATGIFSTFMFSAEIFRWKVM